MKSGFDFNLFSPPNMFFMLKETITMSIAGTLVLSPFYLSCDDSVTSPDDSVQVLMTIKSHISSFFCALTQTYNGSCKRY